MSKKFDDAVDLVKKHLEVNCYSYGSTMGYLHCYRLLEANLAAKKTLYSNRSAQQWIQSIEPVIRKSTYNLYRIALKKLDDAYHKREISDTNSMSIARKHREELNPWCKDLLNDFVKEILTRYTSAYPYTIRTSVVFFLTTWYTGVYLNRRKYHIELLRIITMTIDVTTSIKISIIAVYARFFAIYLSEVKFKTQFP